VYVDGRDAPEAAGRVATAAMTGAAIALAFRVT
jgi:hypothetical protein